MTSHLFNFKSCRLAIGCGISIEIDGRHVYGVISSESRADLEAILDQIGEPDNPEPSLYYSVLQVDGDLKGIRHPEVKAIRSTLAHWWWCVGELFGVDGLERSQVADEEAYFLADRDDDGAKSRRDLIRSWFKGADAVRDAHPTTLNGLGCQED